MAFAVDSKKMPDGEEAMKKALSGYRTRLSDAIDNLPDYASANFVLDALESKVGFQAFGIDHKHRSLWQLITHKPPHIDGKLTNVAERVIKIVETHEDIETAKLLQKALNGDKQAEEILLKKSEGPSLRGDGYAEEVAFLVKRALNGDKRIQDILMGKKHEAEVHLEVMRDDTSLKHDVRKVLRSEL